MRIFNIKEQGKDETGLVLYNTYLDTSYITKKETAKVQCINRNVDFIETVADIFNGYYFPLPDDIVQEFGENKTTLLYTTL